MQQTMEFLAVSSLEKVFPDETPYVSPLLGKESILKGECYTFQIAFRGRQSNTHQMVKLFPRANTDLCITVRSVGLVPAELTKFSTQDNDFLHDGKPGLYPDILLEIDEYNPIIALNTMWRSVWVEFTPDDDMDGGLYPIEIEFLDKDGTSYGSAGTTVELIDKKLEPQKLIYTEWFHGDCISAYYNVKSLSDKHFTLMEKYIAMAVRNGINMILTPVFTPPLDTAVGGERPTIQLVEIGVNGGHYTFNFANLQRFVDICKKQGVVYYEMPHLFTQWGGNAAPKIMATSGGLYKQIFGWDTPSDSKEYKEFLNAFLPELTQFLYDTGIAQNTFFHISDEPDEKSLDQYKKNRTIVADLLEGFRIIDAISDYSFYEQGIILNPIPSSDHIKPFLENNVKNLWTYYCCAQGNGVSNRFMAMSSPRNRIIATQLFKFDIEGFLHWGYNFWFSQFSTQLINPFSVTDAMLAFPSGDSFGVYPGKEEPIESIRIRVFAEALCDLRAMNMLSELAGKETVLEILEEGIPPIEFDHAPNDQDYILKMRISLNKAIQSFTGCI